MIQRIQSLFLLISLIIQIIFIFEPLAILQAPSSDLYELYVNGYSYKNQIEYSYSFLIFSLFTMVLTLVAIFLYKKRIFQMRIVVYNTIFLIGIQLLLFYIIYATASNLEAETFLQYTAIFPILSAILHLLAFKYIKKDEELVRSADRIR